VRTHTHTHTHTHTDTHKENFFQPHIEIWLGFDSNLNHFLTAVALPQLVLMDEH